MKIVKLFERKFWLPVSLALTAGLLFPALGKNLNILVIPILMMVFFLTCLKINLSEVVKLIKKPKFIFYIISLYLLLVPAVLYYLFQYFNSELAIGMLLLSSMPPGVASVVLTDIFEGNTSLSMAISIPSYILSPFTIPLLFFALTQKQINLDIGSLFQTLLLINFIPLLAAQMIRKMSSNFINATKDTYNFINICLISFMVYIVVSVQADKILEDPMDTLVYTLWMYLLFVMLFLIGYFTGYKRRKEDKIALAVTKSYMNNALAIGLAITFFNPKIALIMVLSEIPWSTTQGIFKHITKYLE